MSAVDIRHELIRKIAETGVASREVVELVINYSFYEANKAILENNNVELTGLGTLQIKCAKIRKILPSLKQAEERMKKPGQKIRLGELIKYLETRCPESKNT